MSFMDRFKNIFSKVFLKEDCSWIYPMSNLRARELDIPVNLWVDDGSEYIKEKHKKYVKFQLNKETNISDQPYASMTLDGNMVEKTYNKRKSELDSRDLKMISNFVRNNQFALSELADQRISSFQFTMIMIPGGEPASEEQLKDLEEKVRNFVIQNGY